MSPPSHQDTKTPRIQNGWRGEMQTLSVSDDRDADDEKEFEGTHLIPESDVLEN
jgi:hypothetical protein